MAPYVLLSWTVECPKRTNRGWPDSQTHAERGQTDERSLMSPRTNFQTNVQTNVTEDKCPDTTPVLSGSLFTPQIFGFYPNFPFKCWAGAAA